MYLLIGFELVDLNDDAFLVQFGCRVFNCARRAIVTSFAALERITKASNKQQNQQIEGILTQNRQLKF